MDNLYRLFIQTTDKTYHICIKICQRNSSQNSFSLDAYTYVYTYISRIINMIFNETCCSTNNSCRAFHKWNSNLWDIAESFSQASTFISLQRIQSARWYYFNTVKLKNHVILNEGNTVFHFPFQISFIRVHRDGPGKMDCTGLSQKHLLVLFSLVHVIRCRFAIVVDHVFRYASTVSSYPQNLALIFQS